MSEDVTKRLFFALEVSAPWPNEWPEGRLLSADGRHMTLAFVGNVPWKPLEALLPKLPIPDFSMGLVGMADRCLFLPSKHPRVVAYHVTWLGEDPLGLSIYQDRLTSFLREAGYELDKHPFLPHVTVARAPFEIADWHRSFRPLPVIASSLHLYESLGHLTYKPIWTYPLKPPFEEISHTADVAFQIRGQTMQQLGVHAQVALGFKFPDIMKYATPIPAESGLDDIIIALNEMITRADSAEGSPLKAVSFHGDALKDGQGVITWEMVVDV